MGSTYRRWMDSCTSVLVLQCTAGGSPAGAENSSTSCTRRRARGLQYRVRTTTATHLRSRHIRPRAGAVTATAIRPYSPNRKQEEAMSSFGAIVCSSGAIIKSAKLSPGPPCLLLSPSFTFISYLPRLLLG